MDHADLIPESIARRADDRRLTVDENFALVGVINAGDHVHQRGLAAAVLAEDGKDLALFHREIDMAVGKNTAKPFTNVSKFQSVHRKPPEKKRKGSGILPLRRFFKQSKSA